MTVVEPGPGMGYFTLEAARLVGDTGRVIALDIQETMLHAVRRRAVRAGLASRIELRTVTPRDLGMDRKPIADLFFAFYMVHEVPDPRRFFEQAFACLKSGGTLLFVEPSGHVSEELFDRELGYATKAGFKVRGRSKIRWSRAAVLEKASPRGRGRTAVPRRAIAKKKG